MNVGPELRRFFAEEVRAAAALQEGPTTERVLDAFAEVPREKHAGSGPWMVRSPLFGLASRRTPNADPTHLYHNVLIALDEERGINIGEPSLWARFLSWTPIAEGSSVLQVGAGSGYYSAILAELAGVSGRVLAMENEKLLADMAISTLSSRANVEVRHGNGATELMTKDGLFDLIIAFAGVTQPAQSWIEHLKPDGRMLLPVTGDNWWGAMILAERDGNAFNAITLGQCGFFPCIGARDEETAKRIDALWSDSTRLSNKKLRIHFEGRHVLYEIDGHTY
jgi:protein-L-isoaspartate(D-aspartate) O-methyltransferase